MTRPRQRLLTALAALAVLLTAATPAAAHGQKVLISLDAAPGDRPGAAEITAVVSYEGDGHPVDGVALRTAATSGTQQVEVPLAPAGAPGTYAGTTTLAPGTWEITTEATGDHTGTAVTDLTVTAATTTTTTEPPATTVVAPEPAAEPSAAGGGVNLALVLIPVGLVAIGAAVLALRRTRRA